ncbi:predicted protein [Arabidopsis lyrata subsp. lyrata]|uniref:Predicted protein n=1 Tax=Arabidopsis lyrata subsp. lyrata TaxID=81972 RepID=D7MM24_ARALL|nr:predicted protein [Arabidopsis lyrata subsp. lyrata]
MREWSNLIIHPRNAMIICGYDDFMYECLRLRQSGYNMMLAYRPRVTSDVVIKSATTK